MAFLFPLSPFESASVVCYLGRVCFQIFSPMSALSLFLLPHEHF
jgi:hypothetical protein